MQKVDAPTLRALKDFNVSRRGYTLIVPRNRATNFTDPNLSTRPLFSLYGLDPVFVSPRKATRVGPPLPMHTSSPQPRPSGGCAYELRGAVS